MKKIEPKLKIEREVARDDFFGCPEKIVDSVSVGVGSFPTFSDVLFHLVSLGEIANHVSQ